MPHVVILEDGVWGVPGIRSSKQCGGPINFVEFDNCHFLDSRNVGVSVDRRLVFWLILIKILISLERSLFVNSQREEHSCISPSIFSSRSKKKSRQPKSSQRTSQELDNTLWWKPRTPRSLNQWRFSEAILDVPQNVCVQYLDKLIRLLEQCRLGVSPVVGTIQVETEMWPAEARFCQEHQLFFLDVVISGSLFFQLPFFDEVATPHYGRLEECVILSEYEVTRYFLGLLLLRFVFYR